MTGKVEIGGRAALQIGIALLVALALVACEGGAGPPAGFAPDSTDAELLGNSEIQADVVAGDPEADAGETVRLTVRVRRGSGAPTPTGFVASLAYDPESLTAVEAVVPDGDEENALRTVNLEAAGDEVKAAGAAPDGFGSEELFAVRMRVEESEWRSGIHLRIEEMDVVEDGFAEISDQVQTDVRVAPGF